MRQIFFRIIVIAMISLASGACASKAVSSKVTTPEAETEVTNPLGEISLKADRSSLDEARKDIPEEIKKENDEVAGILSFIVRESDEEPNRLRDRFNTALRKKREKADREFRKKREDFSQKEKAGRGSFLKAQKEERDDFIGRKRSSEDRKRFFEKQDEKRKEFFADSADRRKDFEASIQEQRKELEDYVREKTGSFNQEWRQYQTRYTERRRALDLKKKMDEKGRKQSKPEMGVESVSSVQSPSAAPVSSLDAKSALEEFDQIPAGPGVPLEPQKKGP